MKEVRDIMGMPVVVQIADAAATCGLFEKLFDYFRFIDDTFSTYKLNSEISRINRGELDPPGWSSDMREIFSLAEETKRSTSGFFDIKRPDDSIDPSGIVKGWAINNATELLHSLGYSDYYIEIGGDIQTSGKNAHGEAWRIGIRNPFKRDEVVKVIIPRGRGVATSGTAARGKHIYNPHTGEAAATGVLSLTVIGPNVYEADRFATAAFAMGRDGITFIEALDGFEGYAIDDRGVAAMTTGFKHYTYGQTD